MDDFDEDLDAMLAAEAAMDMEQKVIEEVSLCLCGPFRLDSVLLSLRLLSSFTNTHTIIHP